jgi:hypothetical protein
MTKSGKDVGAENVERLKAYIDSIDSLPARGDKVHVSAVAEAIGIDRQTLYRNPVARQLLEDAVAKKGLRGIAVREDQSETAIVKLERKVHELEAKNSALFAENWELRRELAKLRHVETLLEQGKRVIL